MSAALAAGVGVLYAVGAVLTTAQLRKADLAPRDTLPLIPLSQLLGRGMSVFLKPFAGVLAIALAFLVALLVGEALERRFRELLGRRGTRALIAGSACALLVLLSPGDVAIAIGLSCAVLLAWVFDLARLTTVLLVWAGVATIALLVVSFYRPQPLPQVSMVGAGGRAVEGDLVTVSGGTWYVGQRKRQFVALRSDDIRDVRICSPHAAPPVFRLLLDATGIEAAPRQPCTGRSRG
jgi:hypothetical protein